MQPSRSWIATSAGLFGLASCGIAPLAPLAAPTSATGAVAVTSCRTGPDGGPLQADRGIGGTGAPSVRLADKGIGGTGIVGIITGFASICVGGREVAYDPAVPVLMDNLVSKPSDLRAGQHAAVEASGPSTNLEARRVTVRHEVIGPVESKASDDVLRVAGQRVAIESSTLGDRDVQPGAWVAVSGFRDPDGLIHATRLDARAAGDVEVHGLLHHEGRFWRIDTLEVRLSRGLAPTPDSLVLLGGRYAGGILYAGDLATDTWETNGASIPGVFGPGVEVVVVETFAGYSNGRLVVGRSQWDRANTEFGRALIEFQRHPDGSLQPTRTGALTPAGQGSRGTGFPGSGSPSGGPAGQRHFEPPPMPARSRGPGRGLGTEAAPGQPGPATNRFGGERNFPGTAAPASPFPGGFPGGPVGRPR